MVKKDTDAPRDMHLRAIPKDVWNIVYDKQNELKKIAGRTVSLERAFMRIVRESINSTKLIDNKNS